MNILGISALYHDSAACLVRDGRIVAAAQEERFTRKRHDASFPLHAAAYCLKAGEVASGQLDAVAFYEKPLTHFVRILSTHMAIAPRGIPSFLRAAPAWLRQKLWTSVEIEKCLRQIGQKVPQRIFYVEHHQSHAASAFYPSPFDSAMILTMDGVGEWATTTVARGDGARITMQRELRFPHSLGLLYSAFTYFAGFKVNSGEYKLMGLAPYGEPRYTRRIYDHLIDLRSDGSFRLNLEYFDFLGGLTMTNERFHALFDGPPRKPESPIGKREMDIARSIQEVTEEVVLRIARAARLEGPRNLCLAGGVALNCVANGRLAREKIFDRIWVQPAAGDAGGALGCALHVWHEIEGRPRVADGERDSMMGSYLGPSFDDDEIRSYLDEANIPYVEIGDDRQRAETIAELLEQQKVIGVLWGRMEFGPRSLGNRSILGDPRSAKMQSTMNLRIKYRESFRPFAPAVLAHRATDYFELEGDSPYMLMVAPLKHELRRMTESHAANDDLIATVNEVRSTLPAITHVDHSARIQTVTREASPEFYDVLEAFEKRTGCPVLVNTSFNVRGEPIVCTPEDAYRCFSRSEMDGLVLGRFFIEKSRATPAADITWREEFPLD